MPAIRQSERTIRILQRLALKNEITVRELYEYFDRQVPKRTLQRDLAELSNANIPLMTRQGHGKELIWYLDSHSLKFIPETIGSQELLASYFLERLSLITKGTKLENNIKSLLNKSKQLVSPDVFQSSDGFDPSGGLFGATFTGYIDYTHHSEVIDNIIEAASTSRICRFTYKATWRDKASKFDANPYLLLYHKGALYAVVYVEKHDNYIFLPVQRIKKIEISTNRFRRDKSFSLSTIRKNRFGIFGHEGLKPQRVVLKFSSDIAEIIAERIWHPTQKITRHKDGSLTLELKTVISDELRSWIGSWLGYVTVIRPTFLKQEKEKQ